MTPQQLDAVVVGAGFGGIGAAIQLRRLGYDNFVILEREDDLGGTWHVNRYPGLAVDIPSTTYSYWFEPNPNWSRLFAPGAELKRYADDVADKYDVRRHMRFNARRRERSLGRGQPELACRARRRRDADFAVLDHRDRVPLPAAHPRHSRHHGIRGTDDSHDGVGRRLRLRRPPRRPHRHRCHGGPARPRAGQARRRYDRLSAHADLRRAQVRLSHPTGRCGASSAGFHWRTVLFAGSPTTSSS